MSELGKTHHTIWKYTAPVADDITLEIPKPATLHTVLASPDEYYQSLDFYFEVDPKQAAPEAEKMTRKFAVRGTGSPFPAITNEAPNHYYAATVRIGPLVWHIFEVV